jgi:hypothetical protein
LSCSSMTLMASPRLASPMLRRKVPSSSRNWV